MRRTDDEFGGIDGDYLGKGIEENQGTVWPAIATEVYLMARVRSD
jgi:hypothetical protein